MAVDNNDFRLKAKLNDQFDKIEKIQHNHGYFPISYSQLFFWTLCSKHNYTIKEVTGRYLWGVIDIPKIEDCYNQIIKENNIFYFHFHKQLPLAKIIAPPHQSLTFYDLSNLNKNEQNTEIEKICMELEKLDLRTQDEASQSMKAIIIKLHDYKYLMLAAFSIMIMDEPTKSLFWRDILNRYQDTKKIPNESVSYLDYICAERAYHNIHLPQYKLMFDTDYDEIPIAKFNSKLFANNNDNLIRKRHFAKINNDSVAYLISYAQQQQLSLENMLVGIFIKALSKYMMNDIVLIQVFNVYLLSELFSNTYGPRLQESVLLLPNLKKSSAIDLASGFKDKVWQQHYHQLPLGFGLGLVFDNYIESNSFEFLWSTLKLSIRPIFSRRLSIPQDILKAYRGLLKFEDYNKNHRDKFVIISFNFQFDSAIEIPYNENDSTLYADKNFLFPFYSMQQNLSFNFNKDIDGSIIFYIDSPFSDEVNNQIINDIEKSITKLFISASNTR